MAWVTKDSVEQYETPESKKEYTKQEKAANWWHYHKLYVGIAVIAVVLVVDGARCCYPGAAGLPRWLCGQQQLADRYGNGPGKHAGRLL